MRQAAVIAAIALAACAPPRADVLATRDAALPDAGPRVLRVCEVALREGRAFDRCDFAEPCVIEEGPCIRMADCQMNVLLLRVDCPVCSSDAECGEREWCLGDACAPCLPDDPASCLPCPFGWERRLRNGCYSCAQVCLPASECEVPMGDPSCGPEGFCVPGMACGMGCAPGDIGCCANQCAPAAAPCEPFETFLGCHAECPPEVPCPTGACFATRCLCDPMSGPRWACTIECLFEPDLLMTNVGDCFYPGPPFPP